LRLDIIEIMSNIGFVGLNNLYQGWPKLYTKKIFCED